MSAVYTHKFRLHGANIRANEQNTAAAVVFDDGTSREFVSAPAKGRQPAEEPTATMQAVQAAKAAMIARDDAELQERLAKRQAAIDAAKQKNAAGQGEAPAPTDPPKPGQKKKA
ncbi:MAG: hypothetical protein H0T51_15085 [Pirellulales bacterium]|nr:hypothetical protein [Pirellulales bacterium]